MAHLHVIAIPANNFKMGGDRLDKARKNLRKRAKKRGYHPIENYVSSKDLYNRILAQLQKDPYPCLKSLEINAHGSPHSCDGLRELTLQGYASRYRKILWTQYQGLCDETHVLFSACNTGLKDQDGSDPIAKKFVDFIPFDRNTFPIHVTAWGTAGYKISGTTAMEKNVKIIKNKTGASGLSYSKYKGGRDAKGRQSWNTFRNW